MDIISLSMQTALIPQQELGMLSNQLNPTIANLIKIHAQKGYHHHESFINAPFDEQILADVLAVVQQKKKLKPALMVVIGIGGSNLGTQAVYEALYGKEGNLNFPLYFADTVDTDSIAALLQRVEQSLQKSCAVLLTVISKSGSTTETIANFECFLALIKKYHPKNYADYIVAITDQNSGLWKIASDQKFEKLAIPQLIGGRYSVLCAVGLFPLACAGVDIVALRKGAQLMVKECLNQDATKNKAAQSAAVIAYQYKKGFIINDLFVFSVRLEGIGKWYRQLMGESIGKSAIVGIMPTVSVGSTDLHSVGQLYLAGPAHTLTTFVLVNKNNQMILIPDMPEYEPLVAHIQGKSLATVMHAIFAGVQKAYEKNKRPFMTVILPEKNAFSLGQFLQFKMIEMVYLGALLQVNPFDQPEVELYKTQTRKILAHE